MASMYADTWWGLALRGLLAILFGIAVFVWPGISLLALVTLIGAYFLVDGIFALIHAFRIKAGHSRWWALLLEGLLGIAVGIMTFIWPGATTIAMLYLIAAWAIITGVLEIVAAIRYADEMEHEWLMGLAGLASVLFGLAVAVFPAAGLLAILWLIGAYAIVFGILMLIAGLRARGHATTPTMRPA